MNCVHILRRTQSIKRKTHNIEIAQISPFCHGVSSAGSATNSKCSSQTIQCDTTASLFSAHFWCNTARLLNSHRALDWLLWPSMHACWKSSHKADWKPNTIPATLQDHNVLRIVQWYMSRQMHKHHKIHSYKQNNNCASLTTHKNCPDSCWKHSPILRTCSNNSTKPTARCQCTWTHVLQIVQAQKNIRTASAPG